MSVSGSCAISTLGDCCSWSDTRDDNERLDDSMVVAVHPCNVMFLPVATCDPADGSPVLDSQADRCLTNRTRHHSMQIRHLAAAALLVMPTRAAFAQATPTTTRNVVPTFGFSVGTLAIDPDAAASSNVGDRAWGLQFDGGVVVNKYFLFQADLGGQFLDDRAQFTQSTTGGNKKSTSNVTYLSASTGVRTGMPASFPVGFALNVGGSATMTRRSIDNCVDCHVDKLKIPGGGFVEPMLLVRVRKVMIRASDRVYMGGNGMRSMISAGVQYDLNQR